MTRRLRALGLGEAGNRLPRKIADGTAAPAKSSAEMQAAHDAWRDGEPLVTSCLFCSWSHDGTVAEGRAAALAHREVAHPEAAVRKTRRRRGFSLRPDSKLSDREYEEAKAARAERDEAERLAKVLRGQAREAA